MVQVIYGDVLLLIDFCMNFFVLYTTGILLRRKIKAFCLCGAALVGGVYSVAKIFINGNSLFDIIISLAIGLLMCYISFGGYKFVKTVFVFFGVSAMVGGIMMCVYLFLGSYHADLFGNMRGYAYSHIPLWLFALLAAISFFLSWIFSHIGRESAAKRETIATVTRKGKSISASLLLDSGNLVKEPISGKNVIMLSGDRARELLSEEEYSAVENKESEILLKNHFRLICAYGVDGRKKTYFGFQPEKITFEDNNSEGDAYIAVCDSGIRFGNNDGIVNPAVLP